MRKPGHARDAIETVRAIKGAGVNVGAGAAILSVDGEPASEAEVTFMIVDT